MTASKKQMLAFANHKVRLEISKLIDKCKKADEKVLGLLQALLKAL